MSSAAAEIDTSPQTGTHPAPVKVLIADDHPLIIAGIRRTIEESEDVEVVGDARSVTELMQLIERRGPDVVLLDLRMPGAQGASHIEQIKTGWPHIKVVVLSACDDRPSIDSALRAGANAYVLKSTAPVDVASLIRQVAGGVVFHAPPAAPDATTQPGDGPDAPLLTEREQTILRAVGAGLTTAAISSELWVTEHTVKFHLTNIYRKIGVANRAGAVRFAIENGLLDG